MTSNSKSSWWSSEKRQNGNTISQDDDHRRLLMPTTSTTTLSGNLSSRDGAPRRRAGTVSQELVTMGARPRAMTGVNEQVSSFKPDDPYESLNYIKSENRSYHDTFVHAHPERIKELKKRTNRLETYKWITCFLIGICTAMSAFFIDFFVDKLAKAKFDHVKPVFIHCLKEGECGSAELGPLLMMLGFNLAYVLVATVMVSFFVNCACGSGIPEIKCFLNGVRYPGWLDFKTMAVKVIGVMFSVGATMPVGKEGPMIHSGAIVAAGLPQLLFGGSGDHVEYYFHTDRAKRDFVSAGAAAGVAAAFGSPIGGVLFSLEEGCSFWSQKLTWRVFFCSMSSLFMLDLLTSGIINKDKEGGGWGNLASGGMIDFGRFKDESGPLWDIVDMGMFVVMGAVGGLLGAFWNYCQMQLTKYRMRRKNFTPMWMCTEALFFAFLNTVIMFVITFAGSCQTAVSSEFKNLGEIQLEQFNCASPTNFNDMASLTFHTLEDSIRNMFHEQGQFSPSLACGAAYGRLVGEAMKYYLAKDVNMGSYALVGAAAFLGGVVRMTISLTVILVEATDQVVFSFPIMVTLMLAKWVGDQFNMGIYDIHIHLKKVPILEADVEAEARRFLVGDVMTTDIVSLTPVIRLDTLVRILEDTRYNGFPVVESFDDPADDGKGSRFLGIIVRHQLLTLLANKCWGHKLRVGTTQHVIPHKEFLHQYMIERKRNISDITTLPSAAEQAELYVDISYYMNLDPLTVTPTTTVNRCYVLFRGLGLRHVPVLDASHRVVGLITRKELTEHTIHEAGTVLNEQLNDEYVLVDNDDPPGYDQSMRAPVYEDDDRLLQEF